jgi:hypothetical protein
VRGSRCQAAAAYAVWRGADVSLFFDPISTNSTFH